ncbi:MAG: phage minor capsid protein [Hydrogeniiclostridium mannosilyticum]
MRYPFTPELLDALPEELAELYRSLEATLLEEICSRLKISGELNEVTVQDIRALRSHGIDMDEIEKAIQRTANISQRGLKKLLDDVVERNQQYYRDVMDLAGVTATETLVSIEDTWAIYEQTRQTFRNLTRSMGFLVDNGRTMLAPARAYQWALTMPRCRSQVGPFLTIRPSKAPSNSLRTAVSRLWITRAATVTISTWQPAGR